MKVIFLLLLLTLFGTAFGQKSIDLVNVYWRTSPYQPSSSSEETKLFNNWVANFTLPIVLNPKNTLVTGFEYQHNDFNLNQSLFTEKRGIFTSYTLQLGLEHKWNDRSKLLIMSFFRLNTDHEKINLSHFQVGGLALGTTSRSSKFDWKYGLYYNGEFFGPMLVPLFGFDWQINDQMRFKLIIPLQFEFSYQPTSWYRGGIRFDGINGSYRSSRKNPMGLTQDSYVDKADNNVWLFQEVNLFNNIWFHIKAGHSILRKYRYYENKEKMGLKLGPVNILDNRPSSSSIIDNGFSFETRLIYRFPIKD